MLARAGRAAEQSRPAAEAVRVVAIGKTKPVSLLRQLRRELRPGVYHQGAAASRRYPVAFRRTLAEQQGEISCRHSGRCQGDAGPRHGGIAS
ncbi:uncharacterized protein LOC119363611 isoform X4 [Triticum dicoccoides]|uniref:uncharacterized protein LOC119363611 isoform X4 n=1 Tax=Triticum dicoccoides TaxID=85692 RepID=UPI00188E0D90|nr:uncharacterized protein LOC119363611 isoform X4 [Triticum dicoccoides]